MRYLFSCQRCGEYRVAKKTFGLFLTPRLRRKIEDELSGKSQELVLKFFLFCPRCRAEGRTTSILKVRRERRQNGAPS